MNNDVAKNELVYTIRDFATAVGMTPWWVHMQISNGGLPHLKIGRRTFIRRADADEWLAKFPVRRGRDVQAQ